MSDTRYVYSSVCTWHGPIQEVASVPYDYEIRGKRRKGSLPGCPHCGGPLLEYPTRAEWDSQATKFADKEQKPLYAEWLETLRNGHCIPLTSWDWRKSYADFAGAHSA